MYQDSFYILDSAFSLSEIEVGAHLYWEVAGMKLHGQVFIVSWLVTAALLAFTIVGTRDLKQAPARHSKLYGICLRILTRYR